MGLNGYSNRAWELERKDKARAYEICKLLNHTDEMSQDQIDVLVLEDIMLDIKPYSLWWRLGYRAVIKRAIARIKEEK